MNRSALLAKLLCSLGLLLLASACSTVKHSETTSSTAKHPDVKLTKIPPAPPAIEQTPYVWERLTDGYGLDHHPTHRRVIAHRKWYQSKQDYIDRVFTRATPYMSFILDEVEKRDMPMEIALLPVVESAFQPYAFSHGSAAGLWQFIPSTGRLYGLKQNWWYDGRRDVYASTHAALDYLLYLHGIFDDWSLALASYNAGPGTVKRAIRRNKKRGKPTDFFSLRLPRETTDYVPKLMALSELVKNPKQFGLTLPNIVDEPAIQVVELDSQIDLAIAANIMEIDMDTLYHLNPAYNRWATPPSGPHRFILPLDKVPSFEQKLAQLPPKQRLRWTVYRVKPGDTLSQIANAHGTSISRLKKANGLRSTLLSINQTIKIPSSSAPSHVYSLEKRHPAPKGRQKITHTVRSGESLWSISRRYKVSVNSLVRWNRLPNRRVLKAGQKLKIYSKSSSQVAINDRYTKKIRYRVRRGESLSHIASKFSVGVKDIARWNPKTTRKAYIHPGDRLTLYVDIRR